MTDERPETVTTPDGASNRSAIAAIPFWKKALLAASIVLMLAGGVLSVIAATGGDDKPSPTTTNGTSTGGGGASNLASGFGPTNGGETSDDGGDPTVAGVSTADDSEPQWSSAMFKLGFSFFVGFAIAFALRTFVKLSMVVIGVFLLVQFALAHYGFIEIHWDVFSQHYDSVGDWLGRQFESLKAFMNGALPSGASAMAGLALGFRKG